MVRLGIAGTGVMAGLHAERFQAIDGCQVSAVCDIDLPKAQAFARKHGIAAAYPSITELLASEELDAVSVVTPDRYHKPVVLEVLAAGKHVLCEKPLATNAADAEDMAAAAAHAGIIHMINLSYRDAPALQDARNRIAGGEIGLIMHVEASYLQSWLSSKLWGDWRTERSWLWRLSSAHGGTGVLGDIGIHILDFATFPVGDLSELFCRLHCFEKAPDDRVGEYVLDANDSAVMQVRFRDGALGSIHTTRWATGHANSLRLRVFGDQGAIEIDLDEGLDQLRICRGAGIDAVSWETVDCPPTPNIYQRFIASIKTGANDEPDFHRGAQLQTLIDAGFESHALGRPVQIESAQQ